MRCTVMHAGHDRHVDAGIVRIPQVGLVRDIVGAVASKVRPGSPALVRSTRPEPSSKALAGVTPSSLTTWVQAVVISADLIWPGVQSGCSALISAPEPAMCGLDMDVPAMAWNSSPCGPSATPAGGGRCCGLAPARICTPGAVMSGLLTPRRLARPAARAEGRHHVALGRLPSHPAVRVAVDVGVGREEGRAAPARRRTGCGWPAGSGCRSPGRSRWPHWL